MVNPTLTYDNEYNRRLRDILTNYDDIEASRNSPTMVVSGMKQMTHIRSGNTPYDGNEGTAHFSGALVGGIDAHKLHAYHKPRIHPVTRRKPRMALPEGYVEEVQEDAMGGTKNDVAHWGKFALQTGIKAYKLKNQFDNLFGAGVGGRGRRKRTQADAVFWRDFADNTANKMLHLGEEGKKLFGGKGKRKRTQADAVFWRDFADNTANKMLHLGEEGKKLLGGKGKRKRRMEDATFWRDFADNTANKGLDIAEHAKNLFGSGHITKAQFNALMKHVPKIMAYNAINNATGKHLPSAFGGSHAPPPKYMSQIKGFNTFNNATGKHLPSLFGGAKCSTGYGKPKSARGAIVSQCMKEHGLTLAQASKYVKEHGLY
jgi:hypothetical protein